jgi:threonine/homoserine/homoserine lactone efflux protein
VTLPLLFAFSFVVGFGAVITPGPISTAIVSESTRRGFVVGPLVAAGHFWYGWWLIILSCSITWAWCPIYRANWSKQRSTGNAR